MSKFRTVLAGLLTLCLTLVVTAQSKKEILMLPVIMLGNYQPGSSQEFTQAMITQVAKLAPNVKLDIARDADLSGLQYSGQTQPPTSDEAARLCAAYGCTNAAWIQLRFTPDYQAPAGGQPGILTVAGAARFWAYRLSDRKIVVDQPVSVARTMVVPAGTSDDQLGKMSEQLNDQCMNQLAQSIIAVGKAQNNQQMTASWGKPNPAATGFSAAYKRMADSIQTYQQDLDQGDLIGSTDSQGRALSAWRALSSSDQKLIEQNYPGTTQWMEGGIYYDIGNSYYPYPIYRGGGRR